METRTKVVVRKLPPVMEEADARELVDSATDGKYTWLSFVQGKISPKKVVHSRCYVNLADPAAVAVFKGAVEARVFVTDRGAQYRGSVEYAPFQKVPEQRVKRDLREGTLDADPDYQAFLERLAADVSAAAAAPAPAAAPAAQETPQGGVLVTPLMAFLQERHAARAAPRARPEPRPDSGKKRLSKGKAPAEDDGGNYLRAAPVIKARSSSSGGGAAGGLATADKAPASKGRPPRAPAPAAQPKQAPPKPPRANRLGAGDAPSAEAEAAIETANMTKTAAVERPERVRAGFGLYQPKRRGRLEVPDQAPSTDPAAGGSTVLEGESHTEGAGSMSSGSRPQTAQLPQKASKQERRKAYSRQPAQGT